MENLQKLISGNQRFASPKLISPKAGRSVSYPTNSYLTPQQTQPGKASGRGRQLLINDYGVPFEEIR